MEEIKEGGKVVFKDDLVEEIVPAAKSKKEKVKLTIDYSDAPVFSREEGFKEVLNRLFNIKDPKIVEIGCIRQIDDLGAGNSTELFAWFVSKYGGKLVSCDLSKANTNLAKSVVSKYPGNISVINMDGMRFLSSYKEDIDFLYLDSYDATPQYYDVAAQHHLELFHKIEDKLPKKCLIMIDDIYDVNTFAGKGARLIPYLMERGYNCILKGYQFLFEKV